MSGFGEDPTPMDSAIAVFRAELSRKIEAIIRDDFEGWNGTIRTGGYVLDVDLTLSQRAKP